MPRKSNRKAYVPIGAAPDSLRNDHTSGHKKSKKDQPRPDQSSDVRTERPYSIATSSKRGGGASSCGTPSDDDGDGDVSNADAAEPDDESDEDGEKDAFAPSDHAIKEHGDQAGHLSRCISDRESTFDGKQSHNRSTRKAKYDITKTNDTAADSDDDIYNRVDLISDSEEDEPNLEQLEERNIIETEEANNFNTAPASVEASDGWEGFELDDGLSFEDGSFFDEKYGRTVSDIFEDQTARFQSKSVFDQTPPPSSPSPSPDQVHFEEPPLQVLSDSDVDSINGDINVLFRPVPTSPVASDGNSDSDGPYQDHEDDDDNSVGSPSGYETDCGDTTEEEDTPASATKRPQSFLRRPSLSSLAFDAQVKSPTRFPSVPAGCSRIPRMGTWAVDNTKPCAAIDRIGEELIVSPATGPTEFPKTSDPTVKSFMSTATACPTFLKRNLATATDESLSNQMHVYKYNDPVLGPGSDIEAASAPFLAGHSRQTSTDYSFTAQSVFVPRDAMRDVRFFHDGDDFEDNMDDYDDNKDDVLLNIDDFIDFGDGSSKDGGQTTADDSSPTSPVFAKDHGPVQLKTPSPDPTLASNDLMKHLDKHIVSAFRRGQPQAQSRTRQNVYALKGVKQSAANAQVGPQKKRKLSGGVGRRPSFEIPAAKRMMVQHH